MVNRRWVAGGHPTPRTDLGQGRGTPPYPFTKPSMRMPVAKEGYPFILIPLAGVIAFFYAGLAVPGLAFSFLALFFIIFFRDPERRAPSVPGGVIAPADGRIVEIKEVEEKEFLGEKAKRVSIFMSPLDVHVNRAPISGRVVRVERRSGGFRAAFKDEASQHNNRNALLMEDEAGRRVLLVQVAGLLARRIICRARERDFLKAGQRFGMIIFGSRVDLYLPTDFKSAISRGHRVWAGRTVLGVMP